ncbi:MAG: M20/M25/M40 family metallo-hydrolase [Candidatus Eremiobacteraeota bacterium]|nr:M20/M25/M40 family metallo-hydrolase [Candidatus Eremiobacteraeota bacterium]
MEPPSPSQEQAASPGEGSVSDIPGGAAPPLNAPCAEDLSDYAVRLFQEYLRIDTTNPPGSEFRAALFFKKVFDREGMENQVFEYAPGRANFYACLKGDGTRRPFILFNHSDVVPSDEACWSTGPFSGEIRDGFIFGRGAVDMKSMAIVQLMAMLRLKRQGFPLKRDIIFLSVADEEGFSEGSAWMAKNKGGLLSGAEFLLDEVGYIHSREMEGSSEEEVLYYEIATTEKSPLWLKLTARGTPGHASTPDRDGAPHRLVRALGRVLDYRPPAVILPPMSRFFRDMMRADADELVKDPEKAAEVFNDPIYHAMTHNTITLTELEGSKAINVIPGEASASLDCRLLPGEDRTRFVEKVKELAGDEHIDVTVLFSYEANASSPDSALVRAVERSAKKLDPAVIVTTTVSPYCDDSHFFRELGIECYGFAPIQFTSEEMASAHGNDERMKVCKIAPATALMVDIIEELNR